MKTAVEMFIPLSDCSGRWYLTRAQRWRVDVWCWLLGHSLWRMDSVVEHPIGSGWRYYVTICLRCGRDGYFQQDYYDRDKA